MDTQLTRLGGPNFDQIPINRPHAPVNDKLRDGFHQHAVHAGVAPYRPNSFDGGCPFHAGATDGAFVEAAVATAGTKTRSDPASYDDHFSQVRQFWLSMTPVERDHIVSAYTFELSKCFEQVIRERQLLALANVDPELCARVAEGLGLPAPEPTVPLVDLPASTGPVAGGRLLAGRRAHGRDRRRRHHRRRRRGGPGDGDPRRGPGAARRRPARRDAGQRRRGAADLRRQPVGRVRRGAASAHARRPRRTRSRPSTRRAGSRRRLPIDPRVVLLLHEAFRHAKAIASWGPGMEAVADAGIPFGAAGLVADEDAGEAWSRLHELMTQHRVWEPVRAGLGPA